MGSCEAWGSVNDMDIKNKKILDACCGSKMFWFDKNHPDVLYQDIREEECEIHRKKVNVKPDVVADFRDMPYPDESFYHVVFDPPHLLSTGPNSIMRKQYGQLNLLTWQEDIKQGFQECMRVLKPYGTLVFKWSESQITVKEVLKLAPIKPLYGNRRGDTHWIVFVKGVIDGTRAD